jgi:predicted enzyme related to lactoylglutathione lyase
VLKVSSVSHIQYRPIHDREKAIDFFVNALGCELQVRGRITYAIIGDTLIEMSGESPDAAVDPLSDRYIFGIPVDNLEEAIAELEAKGATVTRAPFTPTSFWGRQAVVSVPGGPPLALREWRAPDGPHFTDWKPE